MVYVLALLSLAHSCAFATSYKPPGPVQVRVADRGGQAAHEELGDGDLRWSSCEAEMSATAKKKCIAYAAATTPNSMQHDT